jgi:LemA protein
MKNTLITVGVIAALAIMFFAWANNVYDRAIRLQEATNKSWSNVQSSYQRRADLVPQLVATVKGAAENEQTILREVTQARAGIVNAQNPEDLELMGKKINTAINLAFEAYPEIRSTQNFAALQQQLEGTENRINVERNNYNESVSSYNTHVRGVFRKMAIGILGSSADFQPKKGFEAVTEGADQAPEVNFSK